MLKSISYIKIVSIFIATVPFCKSFAEEAKYPEKILICGVCQNVENAFPNTVRQIEKLVSFFADYAVIIYENNSKDNTARLYREWADNNPNVVFISENIDPLDLPRSRVDNISRARNIVLEEARKSKYKDFPYLIMVDLDFNYQWPIEEIVKSIHLPIEWDCISANGVRIKNFSYYDRYAFRDINMPLGSELIDTFWSDFWLFELTGNDFIPVFSAFGGLAIYKTKTILQFFYNAVVNEDLSRFYQQIFLIVPQFNHYLQRYLAQNNFLSPIEASTRPVVYRYDKDDHIQNCCEHVSLHAAMYINGYNKFFINPKMYMYYDVE